MRTPPSRSPRSRSSRVLSPKRSNLSSIGQDDSSSVNGSFSVYSGGIGHDDPTAVMGNVKHTRSLMSLGTIASFLTAEFDEEIEGREEVDETHSREIRDTELREQLAELDHTANSWNAKNSHKSGDSSETPDIEKFYVHEVGDNSPTHRWQRQERHSFPETILEEIETSHIVDQDDGRDQENLSTHPMFMPPGLILEHQSSIDDGRPIEYISSDQSHTSTDQASSIMSVLSDESLKEQASIPEDSRAFATGSCENPSLTTNEIVRQVQKRLLESSENDTKTAEAHMRKVPSPQLEGSLPHESVTPVIDEDPGKQNQEDPEQSERKNRAQNRLRLLAAVFCCGVLAIVIALIFTISRIGSSEDQLASPSNGVISSAPSSQVNAIASPLPSTTPSYVGTDYPTLAPVQKPSLPPEGQVPTISPEENTTPSLRPTLVGIATKNPASTTAPTLHTIPSLRPTLVTTIPVSTTAPTVHQMPSLRPTLAGADTNSPVFTDAPTFVSGRVDTQTPSMHTFPTGGVSLTAAPTRGDNQASTAKRHLMKLSGDLLNDPTTPQYAAYMWLVNEDPANLVLDSLPIKILEQRYIAVLLYFSTIGRKWDNTFDFLTDSNVCEWKDNRTSKGILCDSDETIEDITINENGLGGSLPFELKALSSLRKLELRTNRIGGSVPPELGQLTMLEELDLRQNVLVGTFPESIFGLPNLRKLLMLQNTNLEGTIPESIANAKNLQMISFQRCKLSGSLPIGIGTLLNLYFITFLENNMEGSIPEGLTRLPNLEVLELANNNFTGTIPDFADQTQLYFISFSENKLKGTIPASIGRLRRLLFFDVRDNLLSGPIPSSFNEIPELVTFYASGNSLTGSLPNFAGNIGFLQSIDLTGNQLSGNLSDFLSFTGFTDDLRAINIPSNSTSDIKPTVGRFTRLASLVLSKNRITGSIPSRISELQMLDTLYLNGNKIGGTVPDELSQLTRLKYIDVSNNDFQGTISETWESLQFLSKLDLSKNRFSGSLPSGLRNLRNLDELYMQNNSFTGNVDGILCPDVTTSKLISKLVADCGGDNAEIICSCCTACCTDLNGCN